MKKIFSIYILVACALFTIAQTGNQNYVRTDVPFVKTSDPNAINSLPADDRYTSVEYIDGLGRSEQVVELEVAPGNADIINFTKYDHLGRTPKNYIGYAKGSNTLNYASNAKADQELFHVSQNDIGSTSQAFFEVGYDFSPLNAQTKQSAQGVDWSIYNTHHIKKDYRTNDAQEVLYWTIANGVATASSYYPVGEITVTIIEDEHGALTRIYTDKLGNTVRSTSESSNQSQSISTYYVFDELNHLRFVIPPQAMSILDGTGVYDLSLLTEDFIYEYRYDEVDRIIGLKVPGTDWMEYVYDNLDRVILYQDGFLRTTDEWYFTKYDEFGRTIMVGLYKEPATVYTRATIQQKVDNGLDAQDYLNYETPSPDYYSDQHGYTDLSFPVLYPANNSMLDDPTLVVEATILKVFYFDDYDFDHDFVNDATDITTIYPTGFTVPKLSMARKNGLITREKIRILEHSEFTPATDWVITTYYYDDAHRICAIENTDHLSAPNYQFNEYDFTGRLTKDLAQHKAINHSRSNAIIDIHKSYTYDKGGRLIRTEQTINNDPSVIVEENVYNALSQLIERKLHSTDGGQTFLESIHYRYNERGWLTHINDCSLEITNPLLELVASGATNQYQLSESGSQWMSAKLAQASTIATAGIDNLEAAQELEEDTDYELTNLPVQNRLNTQGTSAYTKRYSRYKTTITINSYDASVTASTNFQQSFSIDHPDNTIIEHYDDLEYDATDVLKAEMTVRSTGADYTLSSGLKELLKQDLTTTFEDLRYGGHLFGMQLHYQDDAHPDLNGVKQYNGNVSAVCWSTRVDLQERGYGFQYDYLNRIEQGTYGEYDDVNDNWQQHYGRYDLSSVTYDDNGNILSAQRNGMNGSLAGNPLFGAMDNLTYQYDGNQLTDVTETVAATGGTDFQPVSLNPLIQPYVYDANGNLTGDRYKGLDIYYNHLNLPQSIQPDNIIAGSNVGIHFLYDANGTKLQKKVVNTDGSSVMTWYSNGFVYDDDGIEFFHHDVGRVVPDNSNGQEYRYEYHYQDHLGNVRLCFSDLDFNGSIAINEILQQNHYYPYGMEHGRLGTTQIGPYHSWTFNNKERHDEFDLHWFHYGARFYDPQLGRWHVIDPSAVDYFPLSPYNYVEANPLRKIDPDGRNTLDALMGTMIGLMTNAVPGSTLIRAHYSPDDPEHYNQALEQVDASVLTMGVLLTGTGPGMMGAGAVASGPSGGTSLALVPAGGLVTLGGAYMALQGSNNAEAGYNYGETNSAQPKQGNSAPAATSTTSSTPTAPTMSPGANTTGNPSTTTDAKATAQSDPQDNGDDNSDNTNNQAGTDTKSNTPTKQDKNQVGAYEIEFESGKSYVGKGPPSRMKQSAKKLATKHNDPVVSSKHTPTGTTRSAFKLEHKMMMKRGGSQSTGNTNTYNKINSPGKKYLEQDMKVTQM